MKKTRPRKIGPRPLHNGKTGAGAAAEAGAAAAQLKQQRAALTKEQQEQAADAAKIAADKAAIAAVNKRLGEQGDYNIWDEVTVYFGNDKVTADPQYDSKLLALCKKATTVTGYVILRSSETRGSRMDISSSP
ncbi:MAG: hypothetical protein WCC25_08480 [Candidatus Korobacteraceae bacterium]